MVAGVSQANVLNAAAAGAGIIGANIVGNMVAARTTNPTIVDGVTVLAGLLVIGMGSGFVRAAGVGMAGMGAARLIQRNFLATV